MLQSAFIDYAAHRFDINTMNPVPNMTPYLSSMPIDSIPPPPANDPDLACRKTVYQQVVGSIN